MRPCVTNEYRGQGDRRVDTSDSLVKRNHMPKIVWCSSQTGAQKGTRRQTATPHGVVVYHYRKHDAQLTRQTGYDELEDAARIFAWRSGNDLASALTYQPHTGPRAA